MYCAAAALHIYIGRTLGQRGAQLRLLVNHDFPHCKPIHLISLLEIKDLLVDLKNECYQAHYGWQLKVHPSFKVDVTVFDRHPLSLDRKSRRPQQDALEFPRDPTLVQLLSTEEFEIKELCYRRKTYFPSQVRALVDQPPRCISFSSSLMNWSFSCK